MMGTARPNGRIPHQATAGIAGGEVNRRNLRKGQLKGEKWSRQWIITDQALRGWLPEAIYRGTFEELEEA